MDYTKIKELEDFLKENLREDRYNHVYRVLDTAVSLAKIHGVDTESAKISALFHDMYKNISLDENLKLVKEFNLDEERYGKNKNLAHSKLAAYKAKNDFKIYDEDILNAISFHTTGRSNMSELEKIVFIADAIEPARAFSSASDIRKLALTNLDEACLKMLINTREYLMEKGIQMDEDSLKAIEYFESLRKEEDD